MELAIVIAALDTVPMGARALYSTYPTRIAQLPPLQHTTYSLYLRYDNHWQGITYSELGHAQSKQYT